MAGTSKAKHRAPRLGPDEFLAPHITRLGRFRKVNPLKARKLPAFSRILGAVGWAVFLEETLRRARKASKNEAPEGEVNPPVG